MNDIQNTIKTKYLLYKAYIRGLFDEFENFMLIKAGSMHWWGNKATSIILIPLTLYLLVDLSLYMGSLPKPTTLAFIERLFSHHPLPILFTSLVLIWHIRAGMEVIIEDYIHGEKVKVVSILLTRVLAIEALKCLYVCYFSF